MEELFQSSAIRRPSSRIVVVGSANTDMILQCDHLPRPGETVLGGRFSTAGGGKGANQAVAAARLGAQVAFVARLGQDALGDQAIAAYEAEGIECAWVSRDGLAPSGVALIMVGADGENLIGVAPGANARLTPQHVEGAEEAIRHADVLLAQLEIPLATVAAALRLARQHGVTAILNPAPAQPLPPDLLQGALLTPNQTEGAQLAGLPHDTPPETIATRLLDLGAAGVVMTLGKDGALLAVPGKTMRVPSFPVQAVDTTAAGDAFNGGLAVALARGDTLRAAVRYACAVAALAVTRLGAQPSLPTREEVETFIGAQRRPAE